MDEKDIPIPQVALEREELDDARLLIEKHDIRMTVREAALLIRELKNVNGTYFEFGMGGSTNFACEVLLARGDQARVVAVDSSEEWVSKVASERCFRELRARGRADLSAVDIGPTRTWGYPVGRAAQGRWADYPAALPRLVAPGAADLVLVDGRFRVACVLAAFLHQPRAAVLVHDFYDRRHHQTYGRLLRRGGAAPAAVAARADTLVRLERNAAVGDAELRRLLELAVADPS